jgi:pyridoxamine 5'-phosphate oxidase
MRLPENADPLPVVGQWLEEATKLVAQPNPNAITLATVGADGRPSARVVLLKSLVRPAGFGLFYTNHGSRKARDLEATPWAAGVMHWDALGRQIRFEGPVVHALDTESDRYFASRDWKSQINAWASRQSQPIESAAELESKAREVAKRFGFPDPLATDAPVSTDKKLPRPDYWGGYRFWFAAVELWQTGNNRFHERLRYERALARRGGSSFEAGPWTYARLQP